MLKMTRPIQVIQAVIPVRFTIHGLHSTIFTWVITLITGMVMATITGSHLVSGMVIHRGITQPVTMVSMRRGTARITTILIIPTGVTIMATTHRPSVAMYRLCHPVIPETRVWW
jgi:hypothetical protein